MACIVPQSSQAPLSLETSSLSLAVPADCSLSPPSHASSPSLYVTFKVFQLVSSFRKRVETRVASHRRTRTSNKEGWAKVQQDFCAEVERQAYDEIDRSLGRKVSHPSGKQWTGLGRKHQTLTDSKQDRPVDLIDQSEESHNNIEWLLSEVNKSVTADDVSLSTLAKDDELFLKRNTDFHVKRLTIRELVKLFVAVKDLLETLKRACPSSPAGKHLLLDGTEILGSSFDDIFIANLEHLLLCLQEQLLLLVTSKRFDNVRDHVIDSQREETKHSECYLFEFPDAKHPLSTTWPWSIRPSLAVIWGVCWMFYAFDDFGNIIDDQGQVFIPRRYVNQSMAMVQQLQEQRRTQSPMGQFSHSTGQAREWPATPMSDAAASATMARHQRASSGNPSIHGLYGSGDQAVLASLGVVNPSTNITSAAAPSTYPGETSAISEWEPEFASGANAEGSLTYYSTAGAGYSTDSNAWHAHEQQLAFGFQNPLPPRSRESLTPSIRVTTDFISPPPPQDNYSSASTQPLQEVSYPPYHTNNRHYLATVSPHNLSPQDHSPWTSMPEQEHMHTPVSPVSPRSPAARDVSTAPSNVSIPRKRSYSEASGGRPQSEHHSRTGSIVSAGAGSASGGDYSPRDARSVRRPEPLTNGEGKYMCTYSASCTDAAFDRKCEWSKHMDKHDRPYRCIQPQCAKLQGFTYSGGLLRHEREVHSKHGGPKAQLSCPFPNCKRAIGKGFTRRENLNEHVRRVHQNKKTEYSTKEESDDAKAGADDKSQTPASRISEHEDVIISPQSSKRKRFEPATPSAQSGTDDAEDLRYEVKRLRTENDTKDERLRNMQERLQQLEENMRSFKHQQQS